MPVGILGGTFDPIHLGHTWIARALLDQGIVDRVLFVPCYTPVHKSSTTASAKHRKAMIELAIADMPHCALEGFELHQQRPVYMVETLAHLSEQGITPALIVGADVWANMHQWKTPERLLSYGHILVINRPDYPWPPNMPEPFFPDDAITKNASDITTLSHGKIYLHRIDFPKEFYDNFSSSALREQWRHGQLPVHRLDPKVIEYCHNHQLYESSS